MKRFTLFALAVAVLVGCGREQGAGTSPARDAITDIKTVVKASDRRSMIGRRVDLKSLTAFDVVGDVLFWAGPTRAESLPTADGAELRGSSSVKVQSGRLYQITGFVGDLRNPENSAKFWRLINERERNEIMQEDVYIFGESISPVGWSPNFFAWPGANDPDRELDPEDIAHFDELG